MERRTPAGRTIRFPAYALRRLEQRSIAPGEVMEVLARPTRLELSRHASRRLVQRRTLAGRRLVVVTEWVAEGEETIRVVVTAWCDGAGA